jgi:hypothetical protein
MTLNTSVLSGKEKITSFKQSDNFCFSHSWSDEKTSMIDPMSIFSF